MAKPRKQKARRVIEPDEHGGPSRFFIVLLIAGLLFLTVLFIQGARSLTPATGEPPADPPSAQGTQ